MTASILLTAKSKRLAKRIYENYSTVCFKRTHYAVLALLRGVMFYFHGGIFGESR